MANFMAMTLARDLRLGPAPRAWAAAARRRLEGARVYTSDQTHFSIARALDLLGFPAETLVVLPSDDAFRLRGAPVAAAIARDRAAGLTPFAIAAVAGSTNTGSVDPSASWRTSPRRRACGSTSMPPTAAAARLSARDADRVPDLDRADSVTVDPHKWFFQAYDIGGLRGPRRQRTWPRCSAAARPSTTAVASAQPARRRRPTATATTSHDDHGDQLNFYKLSFEGTRRWRALKLWMSWKHLGTEGFGRLIEANDDLAAHLARRCAEADDFEALPADPGAVRRLLPPPARRSRRPRSRSAGRARRAPGPAPARARGVRRRLADDDAPARRDLSARRDRQLPLDRGRHRPAARHAPPPRGLTRVSRAGRAAARRGRRSCRTWPGRPRNLRNGGVGRLATSAFGRAETCRDIFWKGGRG